MRNKIIVLLLLFSLFSRMQAQNDCDEKMHLQLVKPYKQLESSDKERFDLSGIVKYKDSIYVIADKEWNNHIYKIDTFTTSFKITSVLELCTNGVIDFEGIDIDNDIFYLIDEWKNEVYYGKFSSCELEKLAIPWEKYNIDRENWGNKGFEGIALDKKNNVLYLAKEREPRKVFKIDLSDTTISEPFADFINTCQLGFDIADMKFENGALYILERGLGLITKIDVKTNAKYSVSFQHAVLNNNQRLFNNDKPEYGMAEALLLTEKEIWVGLDNNGDEVSEYGESVGLEGDKPVILIFKRPEGF